MSRRIAGILAVVGLSASCGSEEIAGNRGILPITPASSQVATVVVTPETSLLTIGDTLRLVASTRDAGGAALLGRVVAWSSDAPAVATVSSSGLITAIAAGLVRVTAVSEGRTGAATVTSVR